MSTLRRLTVRRRGLDFSVGPAEYSRTASHVAQQIAHVHNWVGLDNYQELPPSEDPFKALHSCLPS